MISLAPRRASTFTVTLNGDFSSMNATEHGALQTSLEEYYRDLFCQSLPLPQCDVTVALSSASIAAAVEVVATTAAAIAAVLVTNAEPSVEARGGLDVEAVSPVVHVDGTGEFLQMSPSASPSASPTTSPSAAPTVLDAGVCADETNGANASRTHTRDAFCRKTQPPSIRRCR